MRREIRRWSAWVAILAVALQTVLAGLACASTAAAAPDPALIICHSGAQPGGGNDTGSPPDASPNCCDHCILCSATPVSPPEVAANIAPPAAHHAPPLPVSSGAPAARPAPSHFARGPPLNA